MPSRNETTDVSTLRRSPRAPARVKVKFTGTDDERPTKKRKLKEKKKEEIIPAENVTNKTSESSATKKTIESRKIDKYCWICHQLGDDQICQFCPRVYHHQCLNPKYRFDETGRCPECRNISIDGAEPESDLEGKLEVAIPMILNKIGEKVPMLKSWPASSHQNEKLICIIDLNVLQDRVINNDTKYRNTSDFLSDVKWILHNCYIIYGAHDSLTIKAKLLINECKNELIDFEACSECFMRTPSEDSFITLCEVEHPLVWAKIKGFPYWPAKVLKVIDSVANIRFFGSHDKAKVPISQCYCMSDESPNDKDPKKAAFQVALDEMKLYVRKIVDKRGKYNFFEPKTKFNPGNMNIITKQVKTNSASKPRHNKSSDSLQEVVVPNSIHSQSEDVAVVVVTDESQTEHSSEADDIEFIGELRKSKTQYMNQLALQGNTPFSIVSVNSHATTTSPNVLKSSAATSNCAFIRVDDCEILPNSDEEYSSSGHKTKELSVEESNKDILETVIDVVDLVDGTCNRHVSQVCDENPVLENGENNSEIQGSFLESNSSQPRLDNSYNSIHGMNTVPCTAIPDELVKLRETILKLSSNNSIATILSKYSHKIHSNVNHVIEELISEVLKFIGNADIISYRKREQDLIEKLEKEKKLNQEMKENTDLVIQNFKENIEKHKQKAVEDAIENWKKTNSSELQESFQNSLKEKEEAHKKEIEDITKKLNEINKANEKMKIELNKANEKYKADLSTMNEKFIKEKKALTDSLKKKLRKEMEEQISTIKRTQWCASCLNEASCFCCWNASYCNVICQQNHFEEHREKCENLKNFQYLTETSDNINEQTLPTLRGPSGQYEPQLSNNETSCDQSSSRQTVVTNASSVQKTPVIKTANSSSGKTQVIKNTKSLEKKSQQNVKLDHSDKDKAIQATNEKSVRKNPRLNPKSNELKTSKKASDQASQAKVLKTSQKVLSKTAKGLDSKATEKVSAKLLESNKNCNDTEPMQSSPSKSTAAPPESS